jgi:hypothetical protein
VAKPLGLVSFGTESGPSKPGHCTVSQREIARDGCAKSARLAGVEGCCLDIEGLAKVAGSQSKENRLYHDTVCWDDFRASGAIFAL